MIDGPASRLSHVPPAKRAAQEREHRQNDENEEEDLGPFPREACHAAEAKEGGDQSDYEETIANRNM
jgi:hypothetical protein